MFILYLFVVCHWNVSSLRAGTFSILFTAESLVTRTAWNIVDTIFVEAMNKPRSPHSCLRTLPLYFSAPQRIQSRGIVREGLAQARRKHSCSFARDTPGSLTRPAIWSLVCVRSLSWALTASQKHGVSGKPTSCVRKDSVQSHPTMKMAGSELISGG